MAYDSTSSRQNPQLPIDEALLIEWELAGAADAHDKSRLRSNYLWGCIYGEQAVKDRWEKEIRSRLAKYKLANVQ